MLDIYIVVALLVAVVVVFVASRVGFLPKKSIPVILGAIAAVFGWSLFREHQVDTLKARIKDMEKRIADRDETLEKLKEERGVSEAELDAARARLDEQLAAAKKQQLLLEARNQQERDEIDKLDLPSTIRRYQELHGDTPSPPPVVVAPSPAPVTPAPAVAATGQGA
jgi:Skp family chaperone for outer membrane proteins